MNTQNLARIISIILGPQFWILFLIIVSLLKTNLSLKQVEVLMPVLLILQFFIPLGYILVSLKLKLISAWDLPIRKQRNLFYLIVILTQLLTLVTIQIFGNLLLFKLNLILLVLSLMMAIVTYFWKISLHVGSATACIIILNYLIGGQTYLLYFIIPVLFWSRLVLKRHNIYQLAAGFLLSFLVTKIGFIWLGV